MFAFLKDDDPLFLRKYYNVCLKNAKTISVAGGYFAHTYDLEIFMFALERAGIPHTATPIAPCAFVMKPHDEKLLLVSLAHLKGLEPVTLETRLNDVVLLHREPAESFVLTEQTATSWVELNRSDSNILLVALLDELDTPLLEEYRSIVAEGSQHTQHIHQGVRRLASSRFYVKLAHALDPEVHRAACGIVDAEATAAGVCLNGLAAPCVVLIKPFDNQVAMLPAEQLTRAAARGAFRECIVHFLQAEWEPTPSKALRSSEETAVWTNRREGRAGSCPIFLIALLGADDDVLLASYMDAASRLRDVPFAHCAYDIYLKAAAAANSVVLDDEPVAPCILLLKPFDEKFALLTAEQIDAAAPRVDGEQEERVRVLIEFVQANKLPKPSFHIRDANVLTSWARERIDQSQVSVLGLLDSDSRVSSFMRVGASDDMPFDGDMPSIKLAHTSDAALLTAAAGLASVPLLEAPTAPCALLLKPFDEKYALLPASELAALDAPAFEARLWSFIDANRQPKPSCPIDDGALAASWAAERIAKKELALVALFAADGPQSIVDLFMRFVGSNGVGFDQDGPRVEGVVKAAHTTIGASFTAAAVLAASEEHICRLGDAPAAPCFFFLKPFDEKFAVLPASELSALDDAGFDARLRSFVDANKRPKPSSVLSTVQAAISWAAEREEQGAIAFVALLPAEARHTVDAYMSFAIQPAVKGRVSFAHTTDAAIFSAAVRDAIGVAPAAPCASVRNFQLTNNDTADTLLASDLAALSDIELVGRLSLLCTDNFLPRSLRDVGVSMATLPQMQTNVPVGPSDNTHNIVTISEGVLVVCVEFGTDGDDDQFLGVLEEAAPEGADYGHLHRGWCVSSNRRAMAKRNPVSSNERWHLKGHAVTMLVDVASARVSFWSDGAHATLDTSLPPNTPLTAALGLYQNTATVTALRHIPVGSADPLLAGVRGGRGDPSGSSSSADAALTAAGELDEDDSEDVDSEDDSGW